MHFSNFPDSCRLQFFSLDYFKVKWQMFLTCTDDQNFKLCVEMYAMCAWECKQLQQDLLTSLTTIINTIYAKKLWTECFILHVFKKKIFEMLISNV